jgi:hypothetical protein
MPSTVKLPIEITEFGLQESMAQQIKQAFADTPYPGDDQIVKPESDNQELMRAFRGRDWRALPVATLGYYYVDLPHLTPEAFRYYLPAFMIAVLLHYQNVGTLPVSLMHSLTPPDPDSLEKYMDKHTDPLKLTKVADFLNRASAFNAKEKTAIRTFLGLYRKWCTRGIGELRFIDRALEFWQMA